MIRHARALLDLAATIACAPAVYLLDTAAGVVRVPTLTHLDSTRHSALRMGGDGRG